MKLRVATYNILNTSDRYDEGRERLLKQNLYQLNADIIGLQEVAFGEKQLDELVLPRGQGDSQHQLRHTVDHFGRYQGYSKYEAPFQIPEFHAETLLDPKAQCDGNVLLVCPKKTQQEKFKVIKHEVLHLSAFLNCQRLEV